MTRNRKGGATRRTVRFGGPSAFPPRASDKGADSLRQSPAAPGKISMSDSSMLTGIIAPTHCRSQYLSVSVCTRTRVKPTSGSLACCLLDGRTTRNADRPIDRGLRATPAVSKALPREIDCKMRHGPDPRENPQPKIRVDSPGTRSTSRAPGRWQSFAVASARQLAQRPVQGHSLAARLLSEDRCCERNNPH